VVFQQLRECASQLPRVIVHVRGCCTGASGGRGVAVAGPSPRHRRRPRTRPEGRGLAASGWEERHTGEKGQWPQPPPLPPPPNANKGNAANAGKASAAKGAAAKAEESKKAGNAATKAAVKPGSAGKDCKTAPCQVHCPFNEKCAKVLKEKEKKLGEEKHHPPAAKAAPAAKADAKKPAHGGCDKDPCQDFCPANAGCTKKQITKTNPPAAKAAAAAKKGPR
jgi:hypothetical protein